MKNKIKPLILTLVLSGCGTIVTQENIVHSSNQDVCDWWMNGITSEVKQIAKKEAWLRKIEKECAHQWVHSGLFSDMPMGTVSFGPTYYFRPWSFPYWPRYSR